MVCNSGVGLTPTIDGETLHLSIAGLYDGLALLQDDETGSWWDHITGRCVDGPLAGRRLDAWPVRITTVAAALAADPDLELSRSRPPRWSFYRIITSLFARRLQKWTLFPGGFRATMGEADPRRPEMEVGLGLLLDDRPCFYTMEVLRGGLEEDHGGRRLELGVGEVDRVPFARWADTGERPLQLLTRWYGFSRTFPGCEVRAGEAAEPVAEVSGHAVPRFVRRLVARARRSVVSSP